MKYSVITLKNNIMENSLSETKTKRKRKRFAPDRKYVLQIMRAKGVSEQRAWAMFKLSVELSTYNFNQMKTL